MTESAGATVTRTFAATPEQVFDAWVDPQQFATWFGGSGVNVPAESVAMDVRVGGAWKATMVIGNGVPDINWVGEYVEIDRPSRLVITLSDREPEREIVTVILTAVDGGTQMVFSQTGGHLSPEEYGRVAEGWGTFFDAMADIFASSSHP
jgi:uncharacterized protein YndB with AHSA1/START domain